MRSSSDLAGGGRTDGTDPQHDAALQEFVARAQSGDRDAFGDIYVACHSQIRGFLLRRVADSETAEDLAQQVFVKAWQGLPRYRRTSAPFTAWLYRIARNALVDHYRRSRPTVGLEGIDIADDSDRDAELITAEQFEEVEHGLDALRDDYREVIRMRFLMGLSTREVAAAMDRSEGAVRVLQLRAMRALRAQLGLEEEAA
jgi:RNA polymerase sigma-70 factor (ECF subfamily)